MSRVSRALISVSEKTGIVDFARELNLLGVEILSTGGTARALREQGIEVREVSDYTGFPEIMDGRLKTLHPRVHGGLLGRGATDAEAMRAQGIEPIDLLVVNLYPFERTVSRTGCTLEEAIENIDIGGPAMLRAAAKNHARVTVVTDAADYPRVIEALHGNGGAIGDPMRLELAAKAFACTARYDAAIANYLERIEDGERRDFPRTLSLQFTGCRPMRYGENPHQRAALYRDHGAPQGSLAAARQRQGQELSYNNVADADAALACVRAFAEPACVIVKHANPCGVAVAEEPLNAYLRALRTDPTSAFGGIIAFNRALDGPTAAAIVERQFVEVVIAPVVAPAAMEVFGTRPKVRVLECGVDAPAPAQDLEFKRIDGGLLVQSRDVAQLAAGELRVVSRRAPEPAQLADLRFAWQVVKYVKSNAIVFCRDRATLGIGAGQMSRVYSARIAAIKAADEGLDLAGSVLASDAFFPFRDAVDGAAEAGAAAIIQPGGSIRDEEVIAAADEHDMAMVFTGVRHFRH